MKFLRECCIHDTGTVLKIPFILDRNLAKANCTGNRVLSQNRPALYFFNYKENKILYFIYKIPKLN